MKYKLNKNKSKLDINSNINIKINIDNDEDIIPLGDINHIVNSSEEFANERNLSKNYRFIFTISPIFSNVLHNMKGNTNLGTIGNSNIPKHGNGLNTLNDNIFKKSVYNNEYVGGNDLNYKESLNKHITEVNGWFGFYDPDITKVGMCNFYDLEPTRDRFSLINESNWIYDITYPSSNNYKHIIVNNGLLVVESEIVEVGGVDMIALGTVTRHGLNNGDKVRLSNMPTNNYEGIFTVKKLGLNDGTYKDNYFVVDINPDTVPTGQLFTNGRVKRIYNGVESEYYVREFARLNIKNKDIYPLAHCKTIYDDQIYQIVINEDINIDGLKDNLGRPLSELYLTTIKGDSNNMFGLVKSGFDLEILPGNIIEDVSNVRRIHDGYDNNYFTSQTPLEYGLNVNHMILQGDVCEYNRLELSEKILTDVLHRFNTVNRENGSNGVAKGPRREGYLYKPHTKIKIREFSKYIEQGDANTYDVPDYAEDLGDGRLIWRDMLDLGTYRDADKPLEYPFTNGHHYIHKNTILHTFRQDPFGEYGLYYSGIHTDSEYSPSDPIGDAINNKGYIINTTDEDC